MVIRFLRLKMLNFKGVLGEREIIFNPQLTQILGANRTGKTTIPDAALWCLFGRNSEDKADFGIKTRDKNGAFIPELSHEVELFIEVDGKEVSLKRCWVEKWSKPKQQEDKVLTGHTTNYFVDGNKYTETEYKEYIESLCPESLFRVITNPAFFPSLEAGKQRALLTKMVGEVSNEMIAEGKPEFMAMLEELDGRTLEAFLQHLSYKKKGVKDELDRIPIRIKEQKDEIVKITPEDTSWEKLEGDITAAENAIERIDEEVADRSKTLDTDYEAKATERNAINKLREKVQSIEFEARQTYNNASRNRTNAIREAENSLQDTEREINTQKGRKESAERALNSLEQEKADFRNRWQLVNDEEFIINDNELICPTCKRRLEETDVQEKSSTMEENFNRTKSGKIEALEIEAEQLKKRGNGYNDTIAECNKKIQELENLLPAKKQAVADAKAIELQSEESILQGNTELVELKKEIETRTTALDTPNAASEEVQTGINALKGDKKQLQDKVDSLKKQLYVRETIANKNARIKELEGQEKTLNQQLSELEKKEYTAQEFTKAHIVELEGKVNALFLNVRFTMFDHKLNGALKPICECTVGGVPYSDLNNADRINAGIDIINAICRFNNVYAPCFIDNAESINDVMPMDSQAIHLIVSRDKELVIINN
ncbi:DNA repair exonuclease SbcCD ATPase subunit [Dysgonomonas sp. PFB1-18]|uniref:AAA family ATPase n=1 Tax=unclassified Dysgonomonas TaxID=2630389 RepID=UPI002474EF6A|nr:MULTISPECIES: AAA family ATPase [unclassified Dysgonomonas]MDH6308067.1 DNA repair exonuclease SbcCD ATPase subunit [Dysgonomonas sp. PF1-14]MDH6339606.1 DNA repair exonuclease SbcCD ATPase subunit [Dysgonomonas sp. PF1-16]MDH6381257.1 DNA repair exonuclease SbcCD ATPase subunit [Dysgonomonas sp. PFB1-18]MDH6398469.1 DNA repair exonuclease SbcCD ATPase subunit [Dysgonomonas sp. PF1-23]